MEANYIALVQQRERWWVGWIEEVPGVNSQEEALEVNRADALAATQGAPYEEVQVVFAA